MATTIRQAASQRVRYRIKDEAFGPSPRTVGELDKQRKVEQKRRYRPETRQFYRRNPVSEGPIKRV